MILDVYRAKYNKDFYLNTEYKKCLCGSFSSKKLFGYDRYLLKTSVVVCKNCGLIFCNPMLKKSFIENFYSSDFYRALYNNVSLEETNTNIFEDEDKEDSSNAYFSLKKYFIDRKDLNILEIGSGNNLILNHFKKMGKLFAIDFSNESKKRALNMGISFQQGGVDKIEKFDEKFDIVILSHVIEHFIHFDDDFLEIKKFIKDNTLLYIEVPSLDAKYNLDQFQIAHNYHFTKTTFLFHLNRLGLICIEYGVTGGGKINQWGIFKIGSTVDIKEVNYEYQKIVKIHKKFFYDFYATYLVKLYLNLMIKKIIGKKLTQVIKIILSKIKKH
jgi:ubiquinone/menaquinone biosynthesis C-methylase UbiE